LMVVLWPMWPSGEPILRRKTSYDLSGSR
jgi:hypothetical protein